MTRFFDTAYEGTPTWDIGRPQAAIVRLAQEGAIEGSVLDVGCGTGESALFLAARGHEVVGVDIAAAAIAKAHAKARERGIEATIVELDALRLPDLGRTFDTALDVGMFHSLDDAERPVYATSLAAAVRPDGHAFLLCWNDRNAGSDRAACRRRSCTGRSPSRGGSMRSRRRGSRAAWRTSRSTPGSRG